MSDAKALIKIKDYKKATLKLDSVFKIDSANNEALFLKGKVKVNTEFIDDALLIFQNLLSKGYKKDTMIVALSKAYFRDAYIKNEHSQNENEITKLYEAAISFSDSALNLNPYYFDAYMIKSWSLHNVGKYSESILVLDKAIKLYPDSMNLIAERGKERWELGDKIGSLDDLNKSIVSHKLDTSDLSLAYRFRGLFYGEINQNINALNDLNNAIKLDSNSSLNYSNRALIYENMKINDKACQDYRKAAELGMMRAYDDIKRLCK